MWDGGRFVDECTEFEASDDSQVSHMDKMSVLGGVPHNVMARKLQRLLPGLLFRRRVMKMAALRLLPERVRAFGILTRIAGFLWRTRSSHPARSDMWVYSRLPPGERHPSTGTAVVVEPTLRNMVLSNAVGRRLY